MAYNTHLLVWPRTGRAPVVCRGFPRLLTSSSSSCYQCVLRKTVLCLSATKSCFTVTSTAPGTWTKVPISLVGQFLTQHQTKKTNPRRFFKKMTLFYAWHFFRRCAHSHWSPLFSHKALNGGDNYRRYSSRCVQALTLFLGGDFIWMWIIRKRTICSMGGWLDG